MDENIAKEISECTLVKEETLDLKLELSDTEQDIVLVPTDINKDKFTTASMVNSSNSQLGHIQTEEKMETRVSEEPVNVTEESGGELLANVMKLIPEMQVNSMEVTTPPRITSASGVRTPTGSGVRTPRRVQLITLSSTKKSKPAASENN